VRDKDMQAGHLRKVLSTIRSKVLLFFTVISVLLVAGSIAGYSAKVENEKINKIVELAYEQRLMTGKISRKSLEYVIEQAPQDMKKEIAETIKKIDEKYSLLSEESPLEKQEKAFLLQITDHYNNLKSGIEELLSLDTDEVDVEDGDLLILLSEIIASNKKAEPYIDKLIDSLYIRAQASAARPLLIFFSVTVLATLLSIAAIFGTRRIVRRFNEFSIPQHIKIFIRQLSETFGWWVWIRLFFLS